MSKVLAVLLTCHNRKITTIQCLDSLFSAKLPDFIASLRVFLVDDGSTDGTSDAVLDKFPLVQIVPGSGQLFWNRGMYIAWKTAEDIDPDYYLWLNDDTFIFENAITEVLSSAIHKNNQGVFIGSTCSQDNQEVTTYGGLNFNEGLLKPNGFIQSCDYFQGNFVLVPRQVYKVVGLLDPFFHHAIGDTDYGLRARKQGIKSYIIPVYIGTCEKHSSPPKWCIATVPLLERIKNLYSPLGNCHPYFYSRYVYRHFGPIKVVKDLLSIHLRLVFPAFWNRLKTKRNRIKTCFCGVNYNS